MNDCQEKYGNYRDRESRWLETVLLARRILLIECYSRYISHATKSCLLKIPNLKQNVVKNHSKRLNWYSNLQSSLNKRCYWIGTFWKTRDWSVTHFCRATLSAFATTKEKLNTQKQALFYLMCKSYVVFPFLIVELVSLIWHLLRLAYDI